jgi:hypothetical protein
MDVGSVVDRVLTRKVYVANCLCRDFAGINYVVVTALEGNGSLSGTSSQPGRNNLRIQPLYSNCMRLQVVRRTVRFAVAQTFENYPHMSNPSTNPSEHEHAVVLSV